jgi:hypothetical protein
MSRVWQVRYRERATEMLSVLDVSPKDPQGRAIVRGVGRSRASAAASGVQDVTLIGLACVAGDQTRPPGMPLRQSGRQTQAVHGYGYMIAGPNGAPDPVPGESYETTYERHMRQPFPF